MSSNDNCSPISYILFSEHIKSPKIYHHYFEQDNTSSSPTYTNIPISDAVSAHESVEKSIYSSQIRFFSQLKNALLRNDKTIEEIPQIDINQSMNEMMSFEIPQQELFNACDPCEVLLSQFQNFYETLQNQNPPNERFNLIKGNFEKELEFPEFVPPPKPQCTIEQITTNNESNKFLHSQLNQMKINASQLNETACNVQKNEIEPNSTTVYEKEENSFSYPIPIGDNEQNDDEVIKNFHDVIKEKGVEISEDFQFDIIEKNEEIDISENTSNEQTNTGIEARMNKLHEILTQQSNISNPKFETVPLIPTTLIKTEKYKTDPILQTINQILIPNQYDTEILSNEIDNLSQRIVDIQNALAAASSEETFDDSELVRCEFEANELMQKVAAEKEKFFLESAQSQITELSEKKKQLQTELSHLEKELSAIDEYTEESITDLEKKYQNAKIEYNTKKQEWEEEQKLRAQLHMGFV
ncbi:hypothetical protein GPJ56_010694 [Histomonas meleagridis]|uniref:uncharacterized protein n=1 Tax=Histomonas meleagridis TaxID=135588 RepID=UPI00355940F9|nr:hypothetical protein GPJ56_010694 [Histomonas meleagridis]KAH0801026.1 hypothetical protein GO595_006061 [Histomonas meleagridis]